MDQAEQTHVHRHITETRWNHCMPRYAIQPLDDCHGVLASAAHSVIFTPCGVEHLDVGSVVPVP